MRAGGWHQFGDRSQMLALDQLQQGAGVGVVISPRDITEDRANELQADYRSAGGAVMFDPQFYIPESTVGRLRTYSELAPFRRPLSDLIRMLASEAPVLQRALETINRSLSVESVIAPAVIYEAGRTDVVAVNKELFQIAKRAGDNLGVPTIATVVVGTSATRSDQTVEAVLNAVTALDSAGWYFAFESTDERIPTSHSFVFRLCRAGLTLACTGKPVFHAFAGPASLLSAAFGATAAGIGHSQNLWQFVRSRWIPADAGGGGGDAPPRYFSSALWGTIVYEDEIALLSEALRRSILTPSPYSQAVSAVPPFLPWSRWDANKHLVHQLVTHASQALLDTNAETAAVAATNQLVGSIALHGRIAGEGVTLVDGSSTYQNAWRAALQSLSATAADEFELLRMLRGL